MRFSSKMANSPGAIVWHYLCDPTFSCFDTYRSVTDTHRQTYDDGIYRASIASRSKKLQEGLAVASIVRDVVVVEMTPPRETMRVNLDRNLKRKLAIMRHCTSVTDGH